MVPWDSPPAFKNTNPCTGGGDEYLRLLTAEIIPTTEKALNGVPRWRGIAGYSPAGLFVLYAIYQTDLFSRVGSISGSLLTPRGVQRACFLYTDNASKPSFVRQYRKHNSSDLHMRITKISSVAIDKRLCREWRDYQLYQLSANSLDFSDVQSDL